MWVFFTQINAIATLAGCIILFKKSVHDDNNYETNRQIYFYLYVQNINWLLQCVHINLYLNGEFISHAMIQSTLPLHRITLRRTAVRRLHAAIRRLHALNTPSETAMFWFM